MNGKETSAYVTHIVRRFDSLADQTLFLHTDPASHLMLPLFKRALLWTLRCFRPVSVCCVCE